MTHEHCLVFSTCPDRETAEQLAGWIVEQHLAACVNLVPGLTSIYRWQDAIESSAEHLLLIKTTRTVYPLLEAALRERHPYELPEIVAVPIDRGLPEYLSWISQCVNSDTSI